MSGPWEQYQQKEPGGPWTKYQPAAPLDVVTEGMNRGVTDWAWGNFVDSQPQPSVGERMMQDATAQMLGATQGTSPYPQMYGDPIGEVMQIDGGAYWLQPTGTTSANDLIPWGGKSTVDLVALLRDDGKMMAYPRTEETDESLPSSLGRFLAPGMLAGPVGPLHAATKPAAAAAPSMAEALRALDRQGVRPSLATISDSRALQFLHNTLKDFFPSAGVVQRADAAQEADVLGAVNRVAEGFGNADSAIDAGAALRRGGESFINQPPGTMTPGEILTSPTSASGFNNKAEAVYNRVNELLPPDTSVDFSNTMNALIGVGNRFENQALGELFQNPTLKKWADVLGKSNSGSLSWKDAQAFRSEIGKLLRRPALVADVDRAQLNSIYAALTDDMKLAAQAAGGPQAAQAWQRANDYYRAGLERINGALSKVLGAGSEEQSYRKLLQMMQTGSATESAAALNAIRKSMPAEEWGDVAATVLRRLGDPVPSAAALADDIPNFSPSAFVKNYMKLSPEAREALFNGAGQGRLRSALDDLETILGKLSSVEKLTNRSKTAGTMGSMGLGAWLLADTTSALAAMGGAHLTAHAMTNPTFVRWLASSLENMSKAGAYAGNKLNSALYLPAELTRLNQLARLDPSLREIAAALSAARAEENQ